MLCAPPCPGCVPVLLQPAHSSGEGLTAQPEGFGVTESQGRGMVWLAGTPQLLLLQPQHGQGQVPAELAQSLGFPPSPAVFVQMVLRKGHGKHMSEPPIFSISWSVCGASLGTSLPCRGAPSSAFLTFRQSENKKKDYKTKKLKPGNR